MDGNPDKCMQCPGLYCGRKLVNFSCSALCGSCERGHRSNGIFCVECNEDLQLYGWLFLGIMALCITVAHVYAINKFHSLNKKVWLLYVSVFFEFVLSFIGMILSFEPKFKLSLKTCGVKSLKDWYTILYNPTVNHVDKLHCTQEAVYPLYTSVLVYCIYSLLTMVLFRGFFLRLLIKKFGRSSFYFGLYVLPIVAVIHTCFAGLLYYIYPYLILLLTAIGCAMFLSTFPKAEFMKSLRKMNTILILICYCFAQGYGIVSMTEMEFPLRDGLLLVLSFLPIGFYILTRPFTDPDNFK